MTSRQETSEQVHYKSKYFAMMLPLIGATTIRDCSTDFVRGFSP